MLRKEAEYKAKERKISFAISHKASFCSVHSPDSDRMTYLEVQPSTGICQRTFPCTHTAPNLSVRHDRKLYGKTGTMQDNFFLYPEVSPSTGICA